jgi:hypothetical protein
MNRMFRAWPVLTMTVLVPVSLLALPAVAFAQRSNGGGSGNSASSGGGQASSSGGSQAASSGGSQAASSGGSQAASSGGGHAASSGGSHAASSGGSHAAWSGGRSASGSSGAGSSARSGNSSGTTQARTASVQGAAAGAMSSNGVGRAVQSDVALRKDSGPSSIPPFSRPPIGSPIGHAVPRISVPPLIGGGGGTTASYYGYPGAWGYGRDGYGFCDYGSYGYGGLAGMGLFNLGGVGGFDSFDADYSVLSSSPFRPGYRRAYGTYDPYARSSPGSGSSSSESSGAFVADSRDESGALRLKVKPDNALVYLDGEYVGLVNRYDGLFQKLHLDGGNHRVEIRAAGYQALTFNVRIEPDHTETYRGALEKDAR